MIGLRVKINMKQLLIPEVEVSRDGYLLSHKAAKEISFTLERHLFYYIPNQWINSQYQIVPFPEKGRKRHTKN